MIRSQEGGGATARGGTETLRHRAGHRDAKADVAGGAASQDRQGFLETKRCALRIGVCAGLFLAGALTAWFLWAQAPEPFAPPVRVPFVLLTDPPGAEVLLDDARIGRTSDTGRLTLELDGNDPALHWLEVRAPGYESARRPLLPLAGMTGMQIRLRRAPFEVFVQTLPTGAEIWVDDEMRGFSPLLTRILPAGDRPVRVRAQQTGFKPAVHELAPDAIDRRADVALVLDALPPRLSIATDPPGAAIRIDGEPAGTSPLTAALDPSKRGKAVRIAATLPRHDAVEEIINVPAEPGRPLEARLTLAPAPTCLRIETSPPGGRVMLNGRPLGRAPAVARLSSDDLERPLTIEGLVPGTHYGRRSIANVERATTSEIVLPLGFYAECVVFALDCAAREAEFFELQRSRVKEQIHALSRDQRFVILAAADGRLLVGPEDAPVRATSEQKVRAYDRLDALRPVPTPADPVALLRVALRMQPRSVWLYTRARIDRKAWVDALPPDAADRPTIQVVTAGPENNSAWLRDWLTANRGSFTILDEEQAVANVVPPRR